MWNSGKKQNTKKYNQIKLTLPNLTLLPLTTWVSLAGGFTPGPPDPDPTPMIIISAIA
jgi:hypothetical protein